MITCYTAFFLTVESSTAPFFIFTPSYDSYVPYLHNIRNMTIIVYIYATKLSSILFRALGYVAASLVR